MPSAHAAVKHELLVRYLDAWAPAALHGRKRVTYVDSSPDGASALAAARVFGEFPDLLERHTLTMVIVGPLDTTDHPSGLVMHMAASPDALVLALKQTKALGSPIFGWFDSPVLPVEAISAVAGNKSSEVMLVTTAPAMADSLHDTGLALTCQVELVDRSGQAEMLVFGTSSEKALETFKDELWALDEYAGIRYRDPVDEEHTLLDISLQPNLRPLRRALTSRVADTGESTVALLRTWAVHETIYRSSDATRAVQALVAAGTVKRSPASGRLSPDTVIRPAA